MNIKELRKTMMLAKKTDPEKSTILAMLLDATQKIAKGDGNREANEKDLLAAAKRELKMANQSKEAGIDIGNTIEILEVFIPKTKGAEETKAIIEAIVAELPEKNPKLMGQVMGRLKKEYGDELDMGMASQMVKEALTP
ncbi:MAG: GatB/YqeY domain-containing protein [Thermodesulfobacteriota bacterium]